MKELIDKDALVAEIERLISNGQTKLKESEERKDYESYVALAERIATCINVLSFLNNLEVKEVDLEEAARHYLLHEHISPLNEILHQADIRVEMQYHTDIEVSYKAGFELGLKTRKGGIE